MKTIAFCILLTITTISVSAQTAKSINSAKVAVINTLSFYDEMTGIKKLALAEKQMGMTDCAASFHYGSLIEEIKKLEKQIAELKCQKVAVDSKLLQLQKLKDESQQALKENDACKKKVREQSVEPIVKNVREKLKEFAKMNGYEIVIDKFTIIESLVEINNDLPDITTEFIKYCNDYFNKEKLP